jgi:hypothetical protein
MVLIEADGALVSKDELQSRVWPDVIVAQDNLKVQIAVLRKALGEDRDFVLTEHGRGYRFTAPVRATIATRQSWLAPDASTPQRAWESASHMDFSVIASRLTWLEVRLAEVSKLQGTHRNNGRRQRPPLLRGSFQSQNAATPAHKFGVAQCCSARGTIG